MSVVEGNMRNQVMSALGDGGINFVLVIRGLVEGEVLTGQLSCVAAVWS